MWRWFKWVLLGIVILAAGMFVIYYFDSVAIWPSPNAKYITAVPVDLNQIQSFSKYRSCAGHTRNGYSFERVLENQDDRSMKHYVLPIPEFQGTIDKVKVFAPFDGKVSQLMMEDQKGFYGRKNPGNGIELSTSKDRNVLFGIGHIYFVKGFKVGDKVKAGELLGYAALGEKGNDFDLDLTGRRSIGEGDNRKEILGSVFDHMTPAVLAEFAKYGVTPENTKLAKEYRDANPCNDQREGDGTEPENYVILNH